MAWGWGPRGDLDLLSRWWVIGAAGFLYLAEFLADKIPVVDSVWDAIHTFIRVPAGAVLAASAFAHFNPAVRVAALLTGGTLAFGSHGTKAEFTSHSEYMSVLPEDPVQCQQQNSPKS